MKNLRLGTKLAFFNLLSKIIFTFVFIAFLPVLVSRISLIQTDNELVNKREQVIDIISAVGIEPFIADSLDNFGSFNILKEEFISLEKANLSEDWNFIEVDERELDDETIEYRVLNYSFRIDNEKYLLQIGKSLDSIANTQGNIRKIILIFLIFIILITLISDFFYTERITRPLASMVSKLKHTSNPAVFDMNPVKTSTSDFVKLDNAIIELITRINELISKEREITVNMSHELLTPVSIIRGKLENMLLDGDLNADLSVKIEDSLKTLHRLKTLINSLLFFSRIESQQYIKEDSFNISDLLKEIQEELAPIAADKEITLTRDCRSEFMVRNANRSLMFSMIYNVTNNAIKNTGEGGAVKIASYIDSLSGIVSVGDTGCGISQEQMKDLFSRFRKKTGADQGNNGIGLAITKSIADFHKIGIDVESTPGKGTKFFFRFPENS